MPQSSNLHTTARPFDGTAPWILPGAPQAFETGLRALRAGFLDPARHIFEALAPRESDHPELLLALAETRLAEGSPREAEIILDRLPSDLRSHASVQVLKADCELRRGRIDTALMRASVCSEFAPRDPRCRFLSARLLWLGGEEREAEVIFLSLAGDPMVGTRACAWAVLCGWRQGHVGEVSDLAANLRQDDVVCEGLLEFGSGSLGLAWEPNDLVDPSTRSACAREWEALQLRELAPPRHQAAGSPGALLH